MRQMRVAVIGAVFLCGVASLASLASLTSADLAPDNAELQIPEPTDGPRRAITAMDLVTLRDMGGVGGEGLSLSPDGNHIAFELHQADLAGNTYRVAWFTIPARPGGTAVKVADGGDPGLFFRVGDDAVSTGGAWFSQIPRWSPDSQWIAFRKKMNVDVQVWRARREGHAQEQLTRNAADVEDFTWSADGSKIFFVVQAPRSAKRQIIEDEAERGFLFDERIAPYTSSATPIWPCDVLKPEAGVVPWLYEDAFKPCASAVWVYDINTRAEREATDEERTQYEEMTRTPQLACGPHARCITYGPGRKIVAWLEAVQPGKKGVMAPQTLFVSPSLDGGAPIMCEAPECTGQIRELWWRPDDKEIYFLRAEGINFAATGLYAWSPDTRVVRTILKTDDLLVGCTLVHEGAVCFHEATTTPRKLISIDLQTRTMTTLVDPNPEFRNIVLSPATKLVWKNAFGQETFGHLVKPLNFVEGRRYPLVITTYRSRGFLRGAVGDEYPVQVFAANGFAVLSFEQPEETWNTDTADTWEEANRRMRADALDKRTAQSSLDTAIDLLDGKGIIDTRRIGLSGLSYGAEIVHYALFRSNRIAVAVASGPGWADPIYYYLVQIPGRPYMRTQGLGNPQDPSAKLWSSLSLALNADRVRTPLLIQAADAEYLLCLQTFIALREARAPVEMHVFPDEYHVKRQPKHRFHIYQRNLDWFNFWLRAVEDPDPAKAGQYKRWRELRKVARSRSPAQQQVGP